MSNEVLVKVDNVSKKFCRNLKRSLLYGVQDIGAELFGQSGQSAQLRTQEFWALDNISFELKRGECLGLIGRNGAGKSTILKLLNGLIKPDQGKIAVRGRVGALIELGAGFNPILTGRENIYVNGAVLGFTKKEIDQKFDAIIDFAEIEEFIDMPVQNYSSGMKVRLGFAIAAQMDPDVLLIDEVLAVGDLGFKIKCFNVIDKLLKNAAIIFVSHNLPIVARICSDILLLKQGKILHSGRDINRGFELYNSVFTSMENIVAGNGKAIIEEVAIEGEKEDNLNVIDYLEDLTLRLKLKIDPGVRNPVIGIAFLGQDLVRAADIVSSFNEEVIHNTGKDLFVTIKIPRIQLNPCTYSVLIAIYNENSTESLTHHSCAIQFKVRGKFFGLGPTQLKGEWTIGEQ